MTGSLVVHRTDLVEDTGTAISPEVDVGQVEGGLVMGQGLWTTEQVRHKPNMIMMVILMMISQIRHHPETGSLLDNSSWHYKVPTHRDVPADLRITFYNSGDNSRGVLGSKATGEPSVLAGVGVLFAVRMAVKSARKDGGREGWFKLGRLKL